MRRWPPRAACGSTVTARSCPQGDRGSRSRDCSPPATAPTPARRCPTRAPARRLEPRSRSVTSSPGTWPARRRPGRRRDDQRLTRARRAMSALVRARPWQGLYRTGQPTECGPEYRKPAGDVSPRPCGGRRDRPRSATSTPTITMAEARFGVRRVGGDARRPGLRGGRPAGPAGPERSGVRDRHARRLEGRKGIPVSVNPMDKERELSHVPSRLGRVGRCSASTSSPRSRRWRCSRTGSRWTIPIAFSAAGVSATRRSAGVRGRAPRAAGGLSPGWMSCSSSAAADGPRPCIRTPGDVALSRLHLGNHRYAQGGRG